MTRGMVDLSDLVGPIPPTSDTDLHRARLAVTARAHDTDDARLLLAALGLDHQENA